MRILRARDHRRMPWKNGAGETLEIAVSPPAAVEDFQWRVSMARVPSSGPFSSFPQVDRTLAVLRGTMVLHVEGQPDATLSDVSTPHRFPGDVPARATVIDPVIDLNAMARRGVCSIDLRRAENTCHFQAAAKTLLVLCASGTLAAGHPVVPEDVIWLEAGESAAFRKPLPLAWAVEIAAAR